MQALINLRKQEVTERMSYNDIQVDEFSPDDIRKMMNTRKMLGSGCYGSVFSGTYLDLPVAIKFLKENNRAELLKEIAALKARPHDNIVRYLGACTRVPLEWQQEWNVSSSLVIITELLSGDVEHLLHDKVDAPSGEKVFKHELSLYVRMKIARDGARGLNWLHSAFNPAMAHRDFATKNIFYHYTPDGPIAKVGDLGFAVKVKRGDMLKDVLGTPKTRAPELLARKAYDYRADIYSFGLVLWEMVTRTKPFKGWKSMEKLVKSVVDEQYRHEIPAGTPEQITNLINHCWQHDPNDRPDMGEVVEELEEILLSLAIGDPEGKAFWHTNFFKRENIPWKDFAEAFYHDILKVPLPQEKLSAIGPYIPSLLVNQIMSTTERASSPTFLGEKQDDIDIDMLRMRALRALFAHERGPQKELHVNIEHFGEILKWFPISHPSGVPLLDRIQSLLQYRWFHGKVDNVGELMRGAVAGTFLLRFSSVPGCYTITRMTSSGVDHVRITKKHNHCFCFSESAEDYQTLHGCIDALKTPLGLVHPCPGSRFAAVFGKNAL